MAEDQRRHVQGQVERVVVGGDAVHGHGLVVQCMCECMYVVVYYLLVVHCMHLDSTSYLSKKNFVDLNKIISFATHTYYEIIRSLHAHYA